MKTFVNFGHTWVSLDDVVAVEPGHNYDTLVHLSSGARVSVGRHTTTQVINNLADAYADRAAR